MSELLKLDLNREFALKSDNFTPLTRTPWAGTKICSGIKASLCPGYLGSRVGESWEFSCDPAFPSTFFEGAKQHSLIDLVATYPEKILGKKLLSRGINEVQLLIKLLNADDPLSLQVHPSDDDPLLSDGECGKPESWLILEAEKGQGIYLGFKHSISREKLRDMLLSDPGQVKDALNFVQVSSGDYFEIEPGTPHAIGAGVLLLEPQRILPGKAGKTFRMWDWGRTYNEQGVQDPNGKPRELHIEASLRLIDSETQFGKEFVHSTMRSPQIFQDISGVRIAAYPANPYYRTYFSTMDKNSRVKLGHADGYACLIILKGRVNLRAAERNHQTSYQGGQSLLLPACGFPFEISAAEASSWALVTPSGIRLDFLNF